MLSIRLTRIGKKNRPSYRIIVLDKRKDPWGDYLEDLGHYNPLTSPATVHMKTERMKYWLSVGAQPSGTLHNILVDQKLIEGSKVRVGKPKKKKAKEAATPAAPAGTPASPSAAEAPKK